MSFFGKFKTASTTSAGQSVGSANAKKDPNAPQPTLLEQRLADVTGPVRPDGSDKFFGLENYGSTCYCNSIIQCLYYSAPFRENVLNFPIDSFLDDAITSKPNGNPLPPSSTIVAPYPNLTSPARKPPMPTSPGGIAKPEESKDSPEYRKRQALTVGPVLDITQDNSTKYGTRESLFTSLRDIFEAIIGNQSRTGVVSPHRFLEILRRENEMFRSAMHQDAHEFLNLLLNQVMDSMDMLAKQPMANGLALPKPMAIDMAVTETGLQMPTKGVDTRWVHDLFEGQLTSETRCLTCENTSQRDEAFLDISVDLSPHTSVTSCLRKFSEEEMLCERNKFHCDNCGGLQEAEKRMKIKRLPRILALHLKRFKYTEDLQRLQKLFHRVVYPFHLRLFNTTDDAEDSDRLYELYAVVVHIGGGPYHGHYVSIIKTQDRGWLLFDDEMVEPVDKSYVLNFFGGEPNPHVQDAKQLACAYVLFYQETTMEAMLREQEAEGQPVSSRVSDVEMAKDGGISSPMLRHTNTITTPVPDDVAPLEKLAHAMTAPQVPILSHPTRPTIPHLATTTASSPFSVPHIPAPKSKKELKQEEKERKAASKSKPSFINSPSLTSSTPSAPPSSSSSTTIHEPTHSNPPPPLPSTTPAVPVKEKESGLSRFRSGAMSLRGRKGLFSSSSTRANENGTKHANGNANGAISGLENGTGHGDGAAVPSTPPLPSHLATANGGAPEGKRIGSRFSLGRKRSTALS